MSDGRLSYQFLSNGYIRRSVYAYTKTVIDATMCAIIAWFIRDLLDFAGLSSNLAYITSVFIGYIGTDSIGSLIKRFAAKKAGVEDGGNQ
ncbi:phage holin, lambda family [Escherichia coli]|uniref:phage holin, lambda family n=1 Tax=Escherichia coli TaxID=562 RepID=UPI0020239C0E|nr:phage holin, lambda family [Escherichia coli]